MKIKQKFKDMWRKLRGEKTAKKTPRPASTDAETSSEEVTREEIFPEGKRTVTVRRAKGSSAKTSKTTKSSATCTPKKPSERTRPTNETYRMIDPSNGSCDTSKS